LHHAESARFGLLAEDSHPCVTLGIIDKALSSFSLVSISSLPSLPKKVPGLYSFFFFIMIRTTIEDLLPHDSGGVINDHSSALQCKGKKKKKRKKRKEKIKYKSYVECPGVQVF